MNSISLGYLAGIEIHRINIDSSSEFNGKYYQTKDYFQLKIRLIYPMLPPRNTGGGDIPIFMGEGTSPNGLCRYLPRKILLEGNLFV